MYFVNNNYEGGANGCGGCGCSGCATILMLFGGMAMFMMLCKFFF